MGDMADWINDNAEMEDNEFFVPPEDDFDCEDCDGEGWDYGHNPNDPHLHGACSGSCPVQLQCDTCQGTGIVSGGE